jgi:5-methylcytosine-specific restriction endonuclease McrBC GTP-binding regulatory subunit McrB
MNLEKTMADRHEKILSYLLEKRKENKDLRFWLRRKNTNNRLTNGFWFQGTDYYLSVGFSKKTAGNQSTRSIAFGVVVEKDGSSHSKIEIIFRYEDDKKIIACYKKIIETIGGFIELNPTKYYRVYDTRNILEGLNEFLTIHKPIIETIIKDYNLEDLLLINAKKFDKPLENILKQRDELKTVRDKFYNWLINNGIESGKISSYLRAIEILTDNFIIKIYEINDLKVLKELYEDLKLHQTEENGKYYYAKAPSYGNGRFYSASVGAYIEFLNNKENKNTTIPVDNLKELDMKKEIPLNQILFGPPGTGKTYHTINKAVEIADPDFYELHKENREELKKRFKLLLLNSDKNDKGQIGFSTFHQSFSYEDFVEGIKPVEPKEDDTFLKYEIQEGVFKKICRLATDSLKVVDLQSNNIISFSPEEYDRASFYKISLGNSQEENDQQIFDYCAENNCISIGFGEDLDFSGKDEREVKSYGKDNNLSTHAITSINIFKNYLKIGNYVIVSNGNNYIRAVGKVVGDYEFIEDSPFANNLNYNHFRKVEWIFNDNDISANDIYGNNLHQKTIYKLNKLKVKQDFFVKEGIIDVLKLPKNPKNFVLIVDEINRGNVSSIFGELITLIEKDKRAGGTEELSAMLPYSKKEFKVPRNVFIVGTMNTADRSIEALDTALRRRFSFQEMPPKPYLIAEESKLKNSNGFIDNIDVAKILDTINNRIERLIDKDHKIGHSYFMDIKTKDDLTKAFKDKVIPLLEEYFFGDFGKIGLVLGDTFISKTEKEDVYFADFDEYDSSIKNDLMERSVFEIKAEDEWNFESIYTKSNNS